MTAARVLLAASVFAVAVPAGAQTAPATRSLGQAVSNTVQKHCEGKGLDAAGTQACWDAAQAAMNARRGIGACQNVEASWLEWLKDCGSASLRGAWPFPVLWSERYNDDGRFVDGFPGGGGSGGGGGVTGSWDDPDQPSCGEFDFRLDAAGNLLVPSIVLPTGGAHVPRPNGDGPVTAWGVRCSSWGTAVGGCTGGYWQSSPRWAAALYTLHLKNKSLGSDKRDWFGAWRLDEGNGRVYVAGQRYIGSDGLMHGDTGFANNNGQLYSSNSYRTVSGNPGFNPACPEGGSTGGTFDFYSYSGSFTSINVTQCVMYDPNYSLSASGYAYAEEVAISFSQVDSYLASYNSMGACPISPDLIKRIAEDLTGEPVDPGDVVTGGDEPQGEDLIDDVTELPPPTDNAPPPTSEPVDPTPPPIPPGDEYTHPPTNEPTVTAPEIDWWPDLPSIEVDLGSPACPTYALEVPSFGWSAVLESHCPLIEDNRALISTIIILVFSIASVLIVLRA